MRNGIFSSPPTRGTARGAPPGAVTGGEESTESASRTICRGACRACHAARRFRKRGEHFEIEIVLRVHRAGTGEIPNGWKDREEVLGPEAVRRHVEIGGELLDVEILARLDARKRGDGRHFRAEIEAGKLRAENADRAVGDESVGGACDSEI